MTKKKKLIIVLVTVLIMALLLIWLTPLLMWNNAQKEMEKQNKKHGLTVTATSVEDMNIEFTVQCEGLQEKDYFYFATTLNSLEKATIFGWKEVELINPIAITGTEREPLDREGVYTFNRYIKQYYGPLPKGIYRMNCNIQRLYDAVDTYYVTFQLP